MKGNGGKRPIIEEIDSPPAPVQPTNHSTLNSAKAQRKQDSLLPMVHTELFVETRDNECIQELSLGALLKRIAIPALKQIPGADSLTLHPSQLLKSPIPYSLDSSQAKHALPASLIARCKNATTNTSVEVSAFRLTVSSPNHSKTESVLPFPVDSHK